MDLEEKFKKLMERYPDPKEYRMIKSNSYYIYIILSDHPEPLIPIKMKMRIKKGELASI